MSYQTKLEHFRATLEKEHNERLARMFPESKPDTAHIEAGYKLDKVFLTKSDGKRIDRYMVESRTEAIYGIKSRTQVNRRRQYGTLDTVDQFDWSGWSVAELALPRPGTQAEKDFYLRESQIKAGQKKRGRKPKSHNIKLVASGGKK